MAEQSEKIIQKLGVEFEVDEESKNKAMKALDDVGEKAEQTQKSIASGNEEQSKFIEMLQKDFGSAMGNIVGQFGELASLLKAGGPIAAGAVAFSLIETRAAELTKNAVDINRQFDALKETSKDIAAIWNELNDLGFNNEQSGAAILALTKTGAFPSKEMLREASQAAAGMSKQTGIPIEEMGNIIAQAVRAGTLEPGNIQNGLIRQDGRGILQNLIKGADEAEMSLTGYSKAVFDLWQTTRNYNIDFENTNKILVSWHDELNKGLMTVSDLANLASGQSMSDSQKIFAAQQMGITGSPLEMMTKFEKLLSSPEGIDKLGKMIFERADSLSKSPEELVQMVRRMNQLFAGGSFKEVNTLRGATDFIERYGSADAKHEIREAFGSLLNDPSRASDTARNEARAHTQQVLKDLSDFKVLLEAIKVNTLESRSPFDNVKAIFNSWRTSLGGSLSDRPSTIAEVRQGMEAEQKAIQLGGGTARAESPPLWRTPQALGDSLSESLKALPNTPTSPSSSQPTLKVEHESTIKFEVNGAPQTQQKKKDGKQSFSLPGSLNQTPVVRIE